LVLSSVIVAVAPPWPPAGAGADAILAYFAAHRQPFLVGNYVAGLASLFGLFQVAATSVVVKAREPADGWLWICVLITGTAAHAVGIMVLALFQALAFVAVNGQDTAARALSEAANIGFGFFFVPVAAAAIALALAIRRTGIVAHWLAPLGWIAAAAATVTSLGALWPRGALAAGGLVTIATFGFFCAWSLLVSVALLRPAPPA
jgi:hypothetical protein